MSGLKRFSRRSHRWVGLICCAFLLIISLTALALNHRDLWLAWDLQGDVNTAFSLTQAVTWAVDPFTPQHIVASSDKQLFESFDNGKKWQEVKLFVPAEHVIGIAYSPVTPETLWVALKNIGVFYSEDNGIIWEEVTTLPPDPVAGETLEAIRVGANNQLYVKTGLGLYTSSARHLSPEPDWQSQKVQAAAAKLDWQTLVWKLHTGQFFGSWGIYLYDGVALSTIFLSLTGLVLFRRQKKKRRVEKRLS